MPASQIGQALRRTLVRNMLEFHTGQVSEILAEQVPITDYRLNMRRLAPGERADGAVQFARPGFKQSKDRLLLQLATASAVDTPLLMPIPFVAPGR